MNSTNVKCASRRIERSAQGSQKCRILIVEDEFLIAMGLRSALRQADFEVVAVASNVNDALSAINRHAPDGVILDANLRGQSAEPVAERLRCAGIPFLVLSGYSNKQIGSWLGSTTLITKPYVADDLVGKVASLLHTATSGGA